MARSKMVEPEIDLEDLDLEDLDAEDLEDIDLEDDSADEEDSEDFDLDAEDEDEDEDEEDLDLDEDEDEPEPAPRKRGRPKGNTAKSNGDKPLSDAQREFLTKAAKKSGVKITHFSQMRMVNTLMERKLVSPSVVTATAAGAKALEADGEPAPAKRRGRPPKSETKAKAAGNGRRGRPKGSGGRQAEAVEIVTANPGITIPDIAEEMGLSAPNYLYRVLPQLEDEGKVRKEGKGWVPAKGGRKARSASKSKGSVEDTYGIEYIADEADVSPRKVRAFLDSHAKAVKKFKDGAGFAFPQSVADKIVAALS